MSLTDQPSLDNSASPGSSAHEKRRASRCLLAGRAVRDFGDAFVAVLLPAYLTALGYSPLQVGVLATAALLGSALITLGVGAIGTRHDLRSLLIACGVLMAATGTALATVSEYALLLLVAFVGTTNPGAGSVSVFVPLEHAILSSSVGDRQRTQLFARYSLVGGLGASCGALVAAIPDYLVAALGMDRLVAFKAMFALYALLGGAAVALYAQIPPRLQKDTKGASPASSPLGPSRPIVYRLAALFSLDAFAGGLVVQSLLALWLFERHGMSLTAVGVFFFWSSLLSGFSYPVAAWLSRRFGLVNTMVFTHIPSSLFLVAAAVVPSLPIALGFLLARAALSQMDVPTRSSYVMAVVTPAERAAAASFTSVPRSLAASISPALAGALFAASFRATPLVLCAVLKIAYDLLLLRQFRHVKPPEEL